MEAVQAGEVEIAAVHDASDAMNVQLDLFIDSRAVMLANQAIAALSARDASLAASSLATLRCEAPDYPSLPALDVLTRALGEWRRPAADPAVIAGTVAWLEHEIAPAAQQGLGTTAQAFVGAFFHDLAEVARGLAYEVTRPMAHRAWLCLRCGEWADAEEAAYAIPRANQTSDALHWLCVARYRQRGLGAARSALFVLAWHVPQRLASTLVELGDELLNRDWQAFERACEWETLEEAQLPAWFPAWYLLEHPAVGKELDNVEFPDSPPAHAARLLLYILDLERHGNWRTLTVQREQLRVLNPDLFALYMRRRTVQYL